MSYSKYRNNLFVFFLTIFSILIVSILWSEINLPYFNKYEVIGEYADLNYSSYNDVVRYILFILIPILTFVISLLIFKKNEFINLKDLLLIEDDKYNHHFTFTKVIFFIYSFFYY